MPAKAGIQGAVGSGGSGPPLFAGPQKSGSSRFGELRLLDRESVVEPGGERLDVGGLDGRAAPDAQAGRSVTVRTDVEGDLLPFEQTCNSLCERGLPVGGKRGDCGIDNLQTHAGVRTRL